MTDNPFIRVLDSFEERFWLLEQRPGLSVSIVLAARVEGATTVARWRYAAREVQRRYPALATEIRKEPGRRPYFVASRQVLDLARVEALDDTLDLAAEAEAEFAVGFGAGDGLPARLTLFHEPDRAVLLLAMHHAALDGKSGQLILQDLVAAAAGEPLGPPVGITPGLSALFGLPAIGPYRTTAVGCAAGQDVPAQLGEPQEKAVTQRLTLSRRETSALLAASQRAGATSHGALVASLALAGRRIPEHMPEATVNCSTPVDYRRALGLQDAVGLLIGLHAAPVDIPDESAQSIWDFSRSLGGQLRAFRSPERTRAFLEVMRARVQDEYVSDPFPPGNPIFSNYAAYQPRTEYGSEGSRLRIAEQFVGSPAVPPLGWKVSALSVDGALGLTLVTRHPLPGLLSIGKDILMAACSI
jgi:hypothetical protein